MSLSGEAIIYAASPSDKKAQEGARQERRRRKVIKELFQTEETYLHHLDLIHKFFEFPLKFACLVPDSVHGRLFSNLDQIREVNVTLQTQMEQSTIGQAFCQLGPFLKLYSMYANNHQYALSTLQEWQGKSQQFAQFIARQEDQPEVMGLKLPSLLITPVQRIPRYKMLLEELLSTTPVDNIDYEKLKEAAGKIGEIASHINEHIRQNENFMKMLSIQRSFDSSAPKLLAPGRQFIREGLLKKTSRKGGKSFERMFFLFSDILLYGKPKFLDGGGRSYTCSCVLPLRHCRVEPVFITNLTTKTEAGGVFKITCKTESLVLYSEDQTNAKEWSEEVEKAIRKLCDDRQTLRKPSSNKVPLRGRSLRRHRRQQKQTENRMPGKTPARPLSQVSSNTDDCEDSDSSVKVKVRLDPVRRHFQEIYSSELSSSQEENGPLSSSVDDSPVLRKRARPSECSQDTTDPDYRQSLLEYESSLRGSRGSLGTPRSRPTSQVSQSSRESRASLQDCPINPISQSDPPSDRMKASTNTSQADLPSLDQSELPCMSNVDSSSAAWFPPNSPAHNYRKQKAFTFNMRLRSYFHRLRRAKKGMTVHCSPFRARACSSKCPQ